MSVRPLPPDLQQRAIAELNEDPKRVQDDIRHIKEWLKKQPHLKARTDDQFILTYLRGCKFSLEKTKEKLDMYYTMRTLLPEYFKNRDPLQPDIQKILKMGNLLPLPKLTPNGQRILLNRIGNFAPEDYDMVLINKVNILLADIRLLEEDSDVICGEYIIADMAGVNKSHIPKLHLPQMAKSNKLYEKAYPSRPKGFLMINPPSFFESINKIIQPFLSEKIKSRMKVIPTGQLDELYKVIPKECLPKEYGGEGGSIEEIAAHWKQKVESYRQWFIDDEKYCSNEKKRVGKPKTTDDIFGVEGSFRQLTID